MSFSLSCSSCRPGCCAFTLASAEAMLASRTVSSFCFVKLRSVLSFVWALSRPFLAFSTATSAVSSCNAGDDVLFQQRLGRLQPLLGRAIVLLGHEQLGENQLLLRDVQAFEIFRLGDLGRLERVLGLRQQRFAGADLNLLRILFEHQAAGIELDDDIPFFAPSCLRGRRP